MCWYLRTASEQALVPLASTLPRTWYGVYILCPPQPACLRYATVVAVILRLAEWLPAQLGLMSFGLSVAS